MAHQFDSFKDKSLVQMKIHANQLAHENAILREALEQCAAEYRSPPCTVAQGYAYLASEFARRMAIATAAITDPLPP